MRFIFVRHSESRANIGKVVQGQMDSPLTNKGIYQSKLLGKRLENIKIDHAYSSDLSRAVDTSRGILHYHPNVPLELHPDLREQNKGSWEGRSCADRNKRVEDSGIPYRDFDHDGAEDLHMVWKRSVNFYEIIRSKHTDDQTILVVTHGGVLACLLSYIEGRTIEDEYVQISNTGVSIYEINQDSIKKVLINCTEHLKR